MFIAASWSDVSRSWRIVGRARSEGLALGLVEGFHATVPKDDRGLLLVLEVEDKVPDTTLLRALNAAGSPRSANG